MYLHCNSIQFNLSTIPHWCHFSSHLHLTLNAPKIHTYLNHAFELHCWIRWAYEQTQRFPCDKRKIIRIASFKAINLCANRPIKLENLNRSVHCSLSLFICAQGYQLKYFYLLLTSYHHFTIAVRWWQKSSWNYWIERKN